MKQLRHFDPFAERRTYERVLSVQDPQPARPPIGYDTIPRPVGPPPPSQPVPIRKKRRRGSGCLSFLLALAILAAIYFLLPFRTNILLLGTDSRDPENPLGRTDTMILTSVDTLRADIKMLSLPRDLWVTIPRYGENRINTAYFFAEAESPGSGVDSAIDTIDQNFGVRMDYYVLVKFGGMVSVVDAMGGLDLELPQAMSGYEAGTHHIDGTQALAFVRDRAGSDDFFRIERGQLFIRAVIRQMLKPLTWPRLPLILAALPGALETNLPTWQMPRVALAVLRAGPDGIDGRTVTREMVVPFTTAQGAAVLLPNWDLILPMVRDLFGN